MSGLGVWLEVGVVGGAAEEEAGGGGMEHFFFVFGGGLRVWVVRWWWLWVSEVRVLGRVVRGKFIGSIFEHHTYSPTPTPKSSITPPKIQPTLRPILSIPSLHPTSNPPNHPRPSQPPHSHSQSQAQTQQGQTHHLIPRPLPNTIRNLHSKEFQLHFET